VDEPVSALPHEGDPIDELLSEMEQRLGFRVILAPAGRMALEYISPADDSALRLLIVTSALRHLIVQEEVI
jgi:hypothetical protein